MKTAERALSVEHYSSGEARQTPHITKNLAIDALKLQDIERAIGYLHAER